MNILVLSWRDLWSPRAGGAERVTWEHIRRWSAQGHSVTLFTARYPQSAARSTREGVTIVRRGSPYTVHVQAARWLRRRELVPDVIVDEIHGLPFLAAAYASAPVVAFIHEVARNIWFEQYSLPIALVGRAAERATLSLYARLQVPFLTVSDSTARDLQAEGISSERIQIIYAGLDVEPRPCVPPKESRPTLICLGRVVRMKRVDHAIRALAILCQDLPQAQLIITGAGEERYIAELQRLAVSLGVKESVSFRGRVAEETKHQLLGSAHVLIHPSAREGWGLNVIEANAQGTIAVGYNVPGL
ncbi:MAG: glycosyltransferase family 4 protein, partial [Chloroflexi bacterium]|nr:glycosyltransferase family 4 protein [Chloroflexota bacterium]